MIPNAFRHWSAILLTACASGASVTTGALDPEKAKSLTGTYSGSLACADCSAMEVVLILKPDQTFEEKVTYSGRSDVPFTSLGTYQFANDSTLLLELGKGRTEQYVIRPEALQQLDRKGLMIAGDLAGKYMLHKEVVAMPKPPTTMNVAQTMLVTKMKEGVRFYAVGQEPSWSLDLDRDTASTDPARPDRSMRFRSIGSVEKMTTPGSARVRAQDANVVRYAAEVESGSLIVQIIEQACMDPMSGEAFPYRVRVDVQRGADTSYTRFEGCGRYVPDARLTGSWTLRSLNGTEVDPKEHPGEPPFLEFIAGEERVSGSGGCNRMVGGFSTVDGGIRFGPLAMTMMACPDMALEQAFQKALGEKLLTCAIVAEELTLSHPDGTRVILQRKKR